MKIKKIIQGVLSVFGGLVGYEVFSLALHILDKAGYIDWYNNLETTVKGIVIATFVLIFAFIFYRIAPSLARGGQRLADNIGNELRKFSTYDIVGRVVGLLLGLFIAYLMSPLYSGLIKDATLQLTISIIVYVLFMFVGIVIGAQKFSEIFSSIANRKSQSQSDNEMNYSQKGKKERTPKILDTSVIIDGRIWEILKTGFLEGPIIIPEFVLVELRHIADSSDSLKRTKGRRGLDILNRIQEDFGIEIYNTDQEKALKSIPEVDVKLLKLAQIMKGKVVTNDYNLNKVALIKNVPVLNINELSNAVKPMVIPGEQMTVTLIKQGKDKSQAIAYLDDGTMIVVEDGRPYIGETIEINITSVLQTAAGRMIFGRKEV